MQRTYLQSAAYSSVVLKPTSGINASINLKLQNPPWAAPPGHLNIKFLLPPTPSGQNFVQMPHPSARFDSKTFVKCKVIDQEFLVDLFFRAISSVKVNSLPLKTTNLKIKHV